MKGFLGNIRASNEHKFQGKDENIELVSHRSDLAKNKRLTPLEAKRQCPVCCTKTLVELRVRGKKKRCTYV